MLLIGSQALKIHHPTFFENKNKRLLDWDHICSFKEYQDYYKKELRNIKISYPENDGKTIICMTKDNPKRIYEFNIAWEDSTNKSLLDLAWNNRKIAIRNLLDNNEMIATPETIYILKMSHRYLRNSPHFKKTRDDIMELRKIIGEIPLTIDLNSEWFKEREKETYNYSHPKLNTTKDGFFKDDQIVYTYDHDSIHESMKQLEKPAYEYYKDPSNQVMCSKKLFFDVSEEIRLFGVLEEAYVLALERSQIPFSLSGNLTWTPRESFEYALIKVSSSITSGWFREYSYENYDKVLELYKDDYVDRFWKAVSDGIVRKL